MRLITFGDSWTAGHGIETDKTYKEEANPCMFIQKLRDMNSWPRWVSQKLDSLYINLGTCGHSNELILRDIVEVKTSDFFEPDDIIIVMLSYPYRYKTKFEHDVVEIYKRMEYQLKDHKHFYFNSFYPSFREEDYNTKKLPSYFINPDGCVSDILKEYEIKNDISVWEYGSRSVWNDEENYWEGDYHPNELGYRIIGQYIYDQIKDKT